MRQGHLFWIGVLRAMNIFCNFVYIYFGVQTATHFLHKFVVLVGWLECRFWIQR